MRAATKGDARAAPDGRLLTPGDVARRMGVDRDLVYAWIRSRDLEAINAASSSASRPLWRISTRALEKFIAERSTL